MPILFTLAALLALSPPPADPAPLSGPRVDAPARTPDASEPTLIHRDFDGRLKRLDVHPVAAAVDLLDLTTDQRTAAQRILLTRSLAIEKILREHVRLVVEAQTAFKPGDDGRGQRALGQLIDLGRPILTDRPLLEQVAAGLTDDKARELRRLVNDYLRAAVADRMAGNVDGKKSDRFGAFIAENMALFGKEVEAAGKRVFEGGEKDFKDLSKKLALTPEQESKIQAMFIDMATRADGPPSKLEQFKTIMAAYGLLDEEQKARMREIIAQEARDAGRRAREARGQAGSQQTSRPSNQQTNK